MGTRSGAAPAGSSTSSSPFDDRPDLDPLAVHHLKVAGLDAESHRRIRRMVAVRVTETLPERIGQSRQRQGQEDHAETGQAGCQRRRRYRAPGSDPRAGHFAGERRRALDGDCSQAGRGSLEDPVIVQQIDTGDDLAAGGSGLIEPLRQERRHRPARASPPDPDRDRRADCDRRGQRGQPRGRRKLEDQVGPGA
jgi:hypothetical protein